MSKKRVKLAIIRSPDDTKCPFGLPIPYACKHVGEAVTRMAPLSVLGDEASPREIKQLSKANKTVMTMEAEGSRCPFAGKVFSDKKAVECNFDSNAPGISQDGVTPSPFYSKVYDNIAYDGLYSYPMGWYGDSNISRNLYYGAYSLQGSSDVALQKNAVGTTEDDIKDAVEHALMQQDSSYDGQVRYRMVPARKLSLDEILSWDDYGSWGDFDKGELAELSEEELVEALNSFRPGFATQAMEWLKSDKIPSIVLVETKEAGDTIGDGRGRVNLAVGMNIPALDAITLIEDNNGDLVFDLTNGRVTSMHKEGAIKKLFIKRAEILYALGQKDRFDYLRNELGQIRQQSENPELFGSVDSVLSGKLSMQWNQEERRYDETNVKLMLTELHNLRKGLMGVGEYDLANRVYRLFQDLQWTTEQFSGGRDPRVDYWRNQPKQEFSSLGEYVYHATYPEDAFAMLKTRAIYRVTTGFTNASFTSDLRSAGKFGPVVLAFNAKKMQRRGLKKMHYSPDDEVIERGFTGTETYEKGKQLYINEVYMNEMEWALPIPFKFEDCLEKVIVFTASEEDLPEAEKVKAKLEEVSDVPVEIEFYPASGNFNPGFTSRKNLEDADAVANFSEIIVAPINKLITNLQQEKKRIIEKLKKDYAEYADDQSMMSYLLKEKTDFYRLNAVGSSIEKVFQDHDWYKNYDRLVRELSDIVTMLGSTADLKSTFQENIDDIKTAIKEVKQEFMKEIFTSDEQYLAHLQRGAWRGVKEELIDWAINNIDKVVEESKKHDYFSGWYDIIPEMDDPFKIPKEILAKETNGLLKNQKITEEQRDQLNEVLQMAIENRGQVYAIEIAEKPELINDDIYLANEKHIKALLGNEKLKNLGKDRLASLFTKAKQVISEEDQKEIADHLERYRGSWPEMIAVRIFRGQ